MPVALPLDAVHAELVAEELPADHLVRVVRCAEIEQRRVRQKDEPSPGPEQPRGLGDPLVRVGPQRRTVLGDRKIEGRIRQRHRFARSLHQRELASGLLHHAARGRELRRRRVDAGHPSSAPGEPGAEVRRAATELDHVESVHLGEGADLSSGIENTPQRIPSCSHARRAFGSVCSAFVCVHSAMFAAIESSIPSLQVRLPDFLCGPATGPVDGMSVVVRVVDGVASPAAARAARRSRSRCPRRTRIHSPCDRWYSMPG